MSITERRGVAVVTGGSVGVGRAVVRRLAEEGSFGDQQGGFLNPKFLVTLPSPAVDIVGAVVDATRFRLKRTARSKQLR